MIIREVGLLCTLGNRSKAYLQLMRRHQILPHYCLIMTNDVDTVDTVNMNRSTSYTGDYFDVNEPVIQTLQDCQIPYEFIRTEQVNDPAVYNKLTQREEEIWIYSGFGGQVIRPPLISCGKKFLHLHPGIVPKFRGSTTIYYSLLCEGTCGVTAMILDEKIDTGPIVACKEFAIPDNPPELDYIYDPYIRASLLVEVLERYAKIRKFELTPQPAEQGETYFIIHPVLKHIAILSEIESKKGDHHVPNKFV